MDPQQQDPTAIHGCDESRCISKGTSHLYNGSHTCYGDTDGMFYPMMCADGFLPIVVEDEPPLSVPNIDGKGNVTVNYFNCCPPYDISSDENDATRHCSDPINLPTDFEANNNESTESICGNQESRKYPRQLKICGIERIWNWSINTKSWTTKNDFFICCDSEMSVDNFENDDENNSTIPINFLDDVECVPYNNDLYQGAQVQNKIGKLMPMCCDVQDGDFLFPRTTGNGANNYAASTGRYECCKNGPTSPPFVQDSTFKITTYTIIAVFCIAAVLSAIVSIALLIPFLIQLKNDRHRRASSIVRSLTLKSLPFISHRLSSSRGRNALRKNRGNSGLMSSGGNNGLTPRRRRSASTKSRGRNGRKPRYSTYNLYVVYLSLLDLTWELCTIGLYVRTINQNFNFDFYIMPVWPTCVDYQAFDSYYLQTPWFIGNVWINAIISYQVLVLLRCARNARRINQPIPTRVSLQAGAAYFLTAISIPIFYFTNDFHSIAYWLVFLLLVMPPTTYIFYAAYVVYRNNYLPSLNGATAKDKAMRELAFYFFRIIAVYTLTNFPAAVFTYLTIQDQAWSNLVYMYLMGLQPILTSCFILTKSDARKYILDLVTLSYLFGNSKWRICRKDKPLAIEKEGEPESTPTSQTKSAADADVDADSNADDDDGIDEDDDEYDAEDELIFSVLGFTPDADETENSWSRRSSHLFVAKS